MDIDGDAAFQDTENKADPITGEIITIPLTGEDELSDIPPEMRETVAAEIAAFRDRSNRRDLERLKREEEIEAQERRANRSNRLASPPPTAPTGPAGANGIPLGPRGVPSGPKGFQAAQNGVNGTTSNLPIYVTAEEEESEASDEELERRRQQKKQSDQEKLYLDYERRWLNRERARQAAIEREKARDDGESSHTQKEKEVMARRLREFNDDAEQSRRTEEYYRDRSQWQRNRALFRQREKESDDRDRAMEEREKARDAEKREQSRTPADYPRREPEELSAHPAREPQRLKISLGAAAQRAQAAAPRRTIAEVEGLLEDEEEVDTTAKRTLVPIKFDNAAEAAGLTEEERHQAVRQLAADIPTDKDGLWTWDVQWDFVDDAVLADQIRPFVEKKMVEYLGVQEEMLVDVVEEHIKKRGSPDELVGELEGVSSPHT
jgi:PWI domain-containing protein